jgi:anti-anti-sigma factor
MQITEERRNETLGIIRLVGQMETKSSENVELRLMKFIDEGVRQLAVDCGGLTYINSMGLRVFLKTTKAIKLAGGSIVLFALPDNVRAIFEVAGFCSIFDIVPTYDEALKIL